MSALKEPLQIDYIRKHALLWNKYKYHHSADLFIKNIFNPFHGWSLFIHPEIHQKTRGFLEFSGSIKRDQCHENGNLNFYCLLILLLLNWKVSYKMKLLIFISQSIDEIVLHLFNTSHGFFYQFEPCIIYCFHWFYCFVFWFCFRFIDCSSYTKSLFHWG